MRKVSKSRIDEDGVSSTNGSMINDDHDASGTGNATSNDPDTQDSTEEIENEEDDKNTSDEDSDKPSKKAKKSKKQKRKSTKTKTKTVEEEYEVEKVVDSKKIKGKLHYLIRWKGYDADQDTWEPENTLSCPELINKFNEQKENSKNKTKKVEKKAIKRKAKKGKESPVKKTKTDWDSSKDDENAEYEVDRILEVHHKKNGKREFLIHWKGWASKFDSWEPESNLNCQDLIKKFMDKVDAARTTDSRNLRVNPGTTNRFTLQDPTSGRRLSKRRGQSQRVRYDNAE